MKHEEYGLMWKEYWNRKNKKDNSRKPLRNFKELCEELKVDPYVLRGKMSKYDAPKPILTSRCHSSPSKSYYDPQAFKQWWEDVLRKGNE